MPERILSTQSGYRNIRAVILDYGEVLCHPPASDAIDRMARIFHVKSEDYPELYARSRGSYDRGDVTAAVYWSKFAESTGVRIDDEIIERLRKWDVEMWSSINLEMVEWANRLHDAGLKTAILSNMETDMVKHVREHFTWLSSFHCQTFSCEAGLIKPDHAIYQYCLRSLEVEPSEALFVDDRKANVDAARAVGITAIQFQSIKQLRQDLEAKDFALLPGFPSNGIVSRDDRC